jgi:hypothetical protein
VTASAFKDVSVVRRGGADTARDGSPKDVELEYDVFGSGGRSLVLRRS